MSTVWANSSTIEKVCKDWELEDYSGFLGMWVVGKSLSPLADNVDRSFLGRFLGYVDGTSGSYLVFEGFQHRIYQDTELIMQLLNGESL